MTTKRKGYMTLAEHDAQMKTEGKWDEYVARRAQQDEARQKQRDKMAIAEAPLVAALKSAGANVNSAWELVDSREIFPGGVILTLLEHVKKPTYPNEIREGMLRALAALGARDHWSELVEFFEANSLSLPSDLRYVAALTLAGSADDSVIDDVMRLVSDSSFGNDRAPLLLPLLRSKDPRAKMLLLKLRDDPGIGKEIKMVRRLARSHTKSGPRKPTPEPDWN
jgi:hypothetical protein